MSQRSEILDAFAARLANVTTNAVQTDSANGVEEGEVPVLVVEPDGEAVELRAMGELGSLPQTRTLSVRVACLDFSRGEADDLATAAEIALATPIGDVTFMALTSVDFDSRPGNRKIFATVLVYAVEYHTTSDSP